MYMMAVSFIGGGNHSTKRKQPNMGKQRTWENNEHGKTTEHGKTKTTEHRKTTKHGKNM
jgi:hypothetical protein